MYAGKFRHQSSHIPDLREVPFLVTDFVPAFAPNGPMCMSLKLQLFLFKQTITQFTRKHNYKTNDMVPDENFLNGYGYSPNHLLLENITFFVLHVHKLFVSLMQANQAGSSAAMELEGCKLCF